MLYNKKIPHPDDSPFLFDVSDSRHQYLLRIQAEEDQHNQRLSVVRRDVQELNLDEQAALVFGHHSPCRVGNALDRRMEYNNDTSKAYIYCRII